MTLAAPDLKMLQILAHVIIVMFAGREFLVV